MTLKTIDNENFNHYKKPSMVIGFPRCTFKCEKECGKQVCQNSTLATASEIEVKVDDIVSRYLQNNITSAIVFAGLEPFDSFFDAYRLLFALREKTIDDIVIYTGYTEEELGWALPVLREQVNVIVKFGRYIPGQAPHYDEVLGVNLASDNQYAKIISETTL